MVLKVAGHDAVHPRANILVEIDHEPTAIYIGVKWRGGGSDICSSGRGGIKSSARDGCSRVSILKLALVVVKILLALVMVEVVAYNNDQRW